MRRAQAAPSLQSLVRYCDGWSQLSNTPCENSQLSPLGQPPGRRKLGQGTAVYGCLRGSRRRAFSPGCTNGHSVQSCE
uniref:Uncharacterized protein n=1 Tax=Arundo donax TaxID=35708 RepID=A0A0A9CNJ4_ARUDO